ncbi:hypothetical protein C0J52_05922 [Blattella germanica]|nr:hypothetical protein C0J52_05922 [Blattella germanica]
MLISNIPLPAAQEVPDSSSSVAPCIVMQNVEQFCDILRLLLLTLAQSIGDQHPTRKQGVELCCSSRAVVLYGGYHSQHLCLLGTRNPSCDCAICNCQMDPTKQQKDLLHKAAKQRLKQIPKSEKEDLYCPPEETGEIILYPNPENCSEFFQCAYGHLYTHVCGEGLYYCAAMEYCDYPDHCDFSNCQMDPTKQQKNLLQKPPKQNLKQIPKSEKEDLYCPPEETGEIILYPNPENCSEFFQCAYGHLYTHVCGEGLYYCAAREYCDYPDHCDYSNCQIAKETLIIKWHCLDNIDSSVIRESPLQHEVQPE